MKRFFWGLAAFALLLGENAAAEERGGWTNRLEVSERSALIAMNLAPAKGGLRVRLLNPENGAAVTLECNNGHVECRFAPQDMIVADILARVTSSPCPGLTGALSWFMVKRCEDAWIAYVDDQPVARMPELWPGAMIVQHDAANHPGDDDEDDYVQRLGAFAFEDNFLVPAGSEFPPTWEIMEGIWKLHSVTGSVSGASGGYQLARQPKPEKSPNFYTLEGGGTNALVLAGEPFYSRYVYRASVQHNSGTNGVVAMASEHGGYLAFTAHTEAATDRLTLELWRQPARPEAPREALAAVQTELPAGQWLLLEIQTADDRVICRADNIEVIRHKLSLPPGGRFGLFSNMPDGETTRFDDVVAASHEDSFLDSPEDILFATRDQSPGVQSLQAHGQAWLYFPPVEQDATNHWEHGAPSDLPLRQESMFVATSDDFTCGLRAGAETADTVYRFTCSQRDGRRRYDLERGSGTNSVLLDSYETAFTSNRVTLALDALNPHDLRCYADGQLVCFDRPDQMPGGVRAVFGSADGDLFLTAPRTSSRDQRMGERFEKNPLYVNDPYMRHWASPEGQWVTYKDGMTWFKGDITGAVKVRMPIVNGMELHLCIPEDSSNGTCRVSVNNDIISVHTPESGTNAAFTVAADQVPELTFDKKQIRLFTLGLEDTVVWLGGDEALLALAHLESPPQGRKMRISGMTLANLSHTLVKRDNVFDTLFTESLYNWTLNGGRWEVINRFYCEPTWSHMNGESADSLAALWSKYIFSGDFSIEFYAGMRMGWYGRPGDLNLTVMSKNNSAGDGYTAIATGWDPDHSQLYSRLLCDGEIMDITTKYLVPRVRAGNVRHGYQPLVAGGRDIHGAWYGMQLRRIGKRIQYIYDNEPVFDVEDTAGLQDGSLGIWTYRNSMMVARIKIAAQNIKPRPFAFKRIPVKAAEPAPEAGGPPDSGICANERPVQPLTPAHWHPFDTVSHPSVRFRNQRTAHPEMHVTSILGAGTFLVRCGLPPSQPDKLLGWRFEVARHPQALINFEFSTVKDDGKGALQEVKGWTYRLSGTDETRGPRQIIGGLDEFPPSDGTNLVWTPVEVWVPAEAIQSKLAVRLEGFGNLQPSDVQMGLKGNPPGAWYAVRNFREIHRGVPVLSAPPEKRGEIAALARIVNSLPPGELQMVEVPETLDPLRPVIEWAVPELANFGLRAEADSAIPGSILVTPMHPWPSPMLPPKRATTDAQPAPFTVEGNSIRVLVPFEALQPNRMTLALELADGRFFRQVVPMRLDTDVNHPPVLMSLELPEGGIQTFETRPGSVAGHQVGAIASIDFTDPQRGGVLKFQNNGIYGRRLNGQLVPKFNWIETPIVQFRYKGDPMAIVAMAFGEYGFSFSEAFQTHVRFSGNTQATMDDTWRVWTMIPTDACGSQPLAKRTGIPSGYLRFGSRGARDQTGLHSTLCIDDLALGPAVGPNRPFAFKADFSDPDTVTEVSYAILQGPAAFDNRTSEEQAAVNWLPGRNGAVIEPDTAAVPDGIHHLLVRARDGRGLWSHPSDLPFMLDRAAPEVTHAINTIEHYNGANLTIHIKDAVSPPIPNTISFNCLGDALDLSSDNGLCHVGHSTLDYEIDWIWLLRKQLASAKHGDVLPVTLSGLSDAAGNVTPPVRIDIPVDLESDKRPPTILPCPSPPNALWFEPNMKTAAPFFTVVRNCEATTADTPEGQVLSVKRSGDKAGVLQRNFAPAWDPDKFPWLAISVRTVDAPAGVVPFSFALNTGPRRPRGIKDSHTFDLTNTNHLTFVAGQITGVDGDWRNLIINVRAFMRFETEEHKETPDLTYITFYLHTRLGAGLLQIRSLAILAPWNSDHLLPIKAYDLSGIKGLVWSGGTTPDTGIRPANLRLPEDSPHWFLFQISDRNDNLTDTWSIPRPPDSANTKPALAGLEPIIF